MLRGVRIFEYFWNLFLPFKNEVKFQVFYVVNGIDECIKDLKDHSDETIDSVLLNFLRKLC
jgi:hypothetical protein